MSAAPSADPGQRIDKWLWAARFFKTRALASRAVTGGKVHIDGQRIKPARRVRVGDVLVIHRGPMEWEVAIAALSERRGPASEAETLYQETPASIQRRAVLAAQRKVDAERRVRGLGRPTKRDRRRLSELRRQEE